MIDWTKVSEIADRGDTAHFLMMNSNVDRYAKKFSDDEHECFTELITLVEAAIKENYGD